MSEWGNAMGRIIHVNGKTNKDIALNDISILPIDGSYEVRIIKIASTRTSLQNRALHLWCKLIAEALNRAGYTYKKIINWRIGEAVKKVRSELEELVQPPTKEQVQAWLNYIEDSQFVADMDWTQAMVKEALWRPVQVSLTGKKSTASANTEEYPVIYDNINRMLGERFGISVEWPNKDSQQH